VVSRTENGARLQRTLNWGENEVAVGSVQELDALLDRLTVEAEQDTPFMVALSREDESTLSIGLGRPESVASYVPGSLEPPYLVSRGKGDGDGPVEFFFGGQMTEFPPTSAVPVEAARDALRVFFETGELSPDLDWEET
jgi:Immunity protein Imm1